MPLVPGVTRKLLDGTEASKDGHDEVRSICYEEFAHRGMSYLFAEWAYLFFKKMTTIWSL